MIKNLEENTFKVSQTIILDKNYLLYVALNTFNFIMNWPTFAQGCPGKFYPESIKI